ncbi:MAG: hypothetical protein PVJ63_11740 [Thioalkalispiraceae bacterium]|jgi:hypothetical protein
MANKNRWVMGSAIGVAAILVAIDHTRHTLPEAEPAEISIQDEATESPCSLEAAPCSMDVSPCSMEDTISPCSL